MEQIQLVPASGETMRKIKALYRVSFPKEERKPFWLIEEKAKQGQMEVFAIEDDANTFYGLVITICYKDLLLLDYFAIAGQWQGQGIGSHVFTLIQNHAGERRLVLEIESTEKDTPDRAIRLRRKAFYQRLGMVEMPYLVNLFGVEMEVLTLGGAVSYDEYHAIFTGVFGESIGKHVEKL